MNVLHYFGVAVLVIIHIGFSEEWSDKTVDCHKLIQNGKLLTCCRGWKYKQGSECVPICRITCKENAVCSAPNVCTCKHGYSEGENGTCNPICDACQYGDCVSPGECKCYGGYKMYNGKCEPQCNETCVNGFCTAPNFCACHDGFQKSDKKANECIKPCETACENGKCDFMTGQCRCNTGYNITQNKCEPLCSETCFNGFCTAPNTCACNDGFQKSDMRVNDCIKPCITACENGKCNLITGKCVCDLGYEWNEISLICEPGPMVNCSSCAFNCSDDGCSCFNGSVCFLPSTSPEASETQMAGLRPVWIGGGLVALFLLVLVVVVMQHISRKKKDYITNEDKRGLEVGSVLYARPNTLLQQRVQEHQEQNEDEETETMIRNREF